ncbi:MAG: phosphatase [Lachnospiraceae bacterium]|nr:phosphatase [Lachnospiraceae bacterium]
MKHLLDVHTHTLASGHAYSTMNEMIAAAQKNGLELLGITEHGIAMPGTCMEYYFMNSRIIDRHAYPVELMIGTELNIMDEDGNVDMGPEILHLMDLCIASMHIPCYKPGTREANTRSYIKAMKNPYINIIGHPDDARYPIDYKELAYAAKENHVLLELNNSSLSPKSSRKGAADNYRTLLTYCKEYETPVIINSDAHIDYLVGSHEEMHQLLAEENFPEYLVINQSIAEFKKYLGTSLL